MRISLRIHPQNESYHHARILSTYDSERNQRVYKRPKQDFSKPGLYGQIDQDERNQQFGNPLHHRVARRPICAWNGMTRSGLVLGGLTGWVRQG